MSLSGRVLFSLPFGPDMYEEERMVRLAEMVAWELIVDVNRIALNKEICGDGRYRVLVTISGEGSPTKAQKRKRETHVL